MNNNEIDSDLLIQIPKLRRQSTEGVPSEYSPSSNNISWNHLDIDHISNADIKNAKEILFFSSRAKCKDEVRKNFNDYNPDDENDSAASIALSHAMTCC